PASGSQPAPVTSSSGGSGTAGSGRMPSAKYKIAASANEGSGAIKAPSQPALEPAPIAAAATAGSGSRVQAVQAVAESPDPTQDKSSGTFWAKVFKRPSTKQ
ncbi:MAG TPA: hypothetical protein VKX17_07140, partial [Planctomycetota bacterium]|nr:hypothetical protein [Planctomycetota bacterium]